MSEINFTVQRFQEGHPLFTDGWIENSLPEHGLVGRFQSVFGQLIDERGEFVCYTLERKDTLISLGKRRFKLYDSPKNKTLVMLFEDEPGSNTYDRKFELHIVNWAYQLEGCTGVGLGIDLETPMLTNSTSAFKKVMGLVGENTGYITHENFENAIV